MSNMISSSCITTIKMIMIKINTSKDYTINDVSLLKNVTKSESKLPKTKQLSENTALSVFTIILLLKNLSRTNLNASRQESLVLSYNS